MNHRVFERKWRSRRTREHVCLRIDSSSLSCFVFFFRETKWGRCNCLHDLTVVHAARERLDAPRRQHTVAAAAEGEQLELPFLTVYTRTVCVRREKVCVCFTDLTPSSCTLSAPPCDMYYTNECSVCAQVAEQCLSVLSPEWKRNVAQETRQACNTRVKTKQEADSYTRSQVRQEYPLNLSISLSGGKETNKDSHSNCE